MLIAAVVHCLHTNEACLYLPSEFELELFLTHWLLAGTKRRPNNGLLVWLTCPSVETILQAVKVQPAPQIHVFALKRGGCKIRLGT